MDKEFDLLIEEDDDDEVTEFCEVLQENIRKRFPQYGTDRDLNAFGNYLNPCCKGVHLKLVHKFEQTKFLLEEKLNLWENKETVHDDLAEGAESLSTEPVSKLSPTEMLKKQMKEKEMGQMQAGKKGRRGRPLSNAFEEFLTPLRMEMKTIELLGDEKEGVDMLE